MDTQSFSSREQDVLQRYDFPSFNIYSRGVAEKNVVSSMGMPFYRYKVFKTPTSYILTRRKHSAEREKPIGEEERVDAANSLEELLSSNERLLESKETKDDMKLTEDKLRKIIREESRKERFRMKIEKIKGALNRHSADEIYEKLKPWQLDEIERELNSVIEKLIR